MIQRKKINTEQVLPKIKYYCAYQERCRSEVEDKLHSMGLSQIDSEEMIEGLIQDGYLDEKRFATLFAGGKFRTRQWGLLKIKSELIRRGISTENIKHAIEDINAMEYQETFKRLAAQKWKLLGPEKDSTLKKSKLQHYLLQKGYEWELVKTVPGNDDAGE